MRVLITGGAGFIGRAVSRPFVVDGHDDILVFDKLTYAGDRDSLAPISGGPHYRFLRGDICDKVAVAEAFADFRLEVVMHLAAESHIDRSIDGPRPSLKPMSLARS